MALNNLRPPAGMKHPKKRIGRGQGSGNGKTAGRGHKGAKSRSGFHYKRGFEGGQMPLHRRVPKRGFHNPFRVEYEVVNLDLLAAKFDAGTVVTPELLREQGMVARAKSLGDHGESSPEHWEKPLGTNEVHVVITAVAPDSERLEAAFERAQKSYQEIGGFS